MQSIVARTAVVLILLAGLPPTGFARAQDATPGAEALPAAVAPLGLGSVILPDDEASILALFDLLPDSIGGESGTAPATRGGDRIVRAYGTADPAFGPPLSLQAVNLAAGDFFPSDFTAASYVAMAAPVSDFSTVDYGRDGDLVWIRTETTAGIGGEKPGTPVATRPLYTLAWGIAESQWLFTATATDPESLDALVTAFVITADGYPATPVAGGTPTT
jgi:hypothetical protein